MLASRKHYLLENHTLFPRLLLMKLQTEEEHPEHENCTPQTPHSRALVCGGGSEAQHYMESIPNKEQIFSSRD